MSDDQRKQDLDKLRRARELIGSIKGEYFYLYLADEYLDLLEGEINNEESEG